MQARHRDEFQQTGPGLDLITTVIIESIIRQDTLITPFKGSTLVVTN